MAEQLPGFAAAGWIAPSEVSCCRASRDVAAGGRPCGSGRARGREGRVEYQEAATELAFLRAAARGAIGRRAGSGTTRRCWAPKAGGRDGDARRPPWTGVGHGRMGCALTDPASAVSAAP